MGHLTKKIRDDRECEVMGKTINKTLPIICQIFAFSPFKNNKFQIFMTLHILFHLFPFLLSFEMTQS